MDVKELNGEGAVSAKLFPGVVGDLMAKSIRFEVVICNTLEEMATDRITKLGRCRGSLPSQVSFFSTRQRSGSYLKASRDLSRHERYLYRKKVCISRILALFYYVAT